MILHKEYNAGKEDKEKAMRSNVHSKWYNKEYPVISLFLEDDNGKRVQVMAFWCGYFEHLVGVDIETEVDGKMSYRPNRADRYSEHWH